MSSQKANLSSTLFHVEVLRKMTPEFWTALPQKIETLKESCFKLLENADKGSQLKRMVLSTQKVTYS